MTGNNKKLQRARARELDRLEVIRLRAEKKQKKQKAAADKKTLQSPIGHPIKTGCQGIPHRRKSKTCRAAGAYPFKREKAHYLTLDPAEKKIFRRKRRASGGSKGALPVLRPRPSNTCFWLRLSAVLCMPAKWPTAL